MDVLKIRKSLRMTQAEFADAIGVDKSVVYKYEHGLLNPSKKRREKIDYIVSLGGKDTAVVETEYFDNEAGKGRIVDGFIRRLMITGSAKAWCCVGIMMLGVALMMASMAFIDNSAMMTLFIILGIACFLGGVILHYAWVRCPHCGSHLGRVYGPKCPFCGRDYNQP